MNFYSNKNEDGFTLIELLVVISIIVLLSSVVIGFLVHTRQKSRDAKRFQDLSQIKNALELYALDHGGKYPLPASIDFTNNPTILTSSGDVTNPTQENQCGTSGGWNTELQNALKPYIKELSPDPFNTDGHCYVYSPEIDSSGNAIGALLWSSFETGSNSGTALVSGHVVGTVTGTSGSSGGFGSGSSIPPTIPTGTTFQTVTSGGGSNGGNNSTSTGGTGTTYTVGPPNGVSVAFTNYGSGNHGCDGVIECTPSIYVHTYRVYAKRIIDGNTIYSDGYSEGSITEDGVLTDFLLTWNEVEDADGYRVLVDAFGTREGFMSCADTVDTSLLDDGHIWYDNCGGEVTPTSYTAAP